jgi:hypothetical protein
MRDREIAIPRVLQELHGEKATVFDLSLVYATGLAFGVLALIFAFSRVEALPWWKALLLFVVAADLSGGVVASFTEGTDRWYAQRPGLRWAFIVLHVIQPALLFVLFGGRIAYWAFLYTYTAAAAVLVNILHERRRQESAAAALVAVGMVVFLPIGLATPFLAWFGPVYLVKLILAFAVRRTTEE